MSAGRSMTADVSSSAGEGTSLDTTFYPLIASLINATTKRMDVQLGALANIAMPA